MINIDTNKAIGSSLFWLGALMAIINPSNLAWIFWGYVAAVIGAVACLK